MWNGKVLAESNNTLIIEGNHYFPSDAVNWVYFNESDTHTFCPWKGTASYHNISVDGKTNTDAAWFYPDTKYAAQKLKNYIAFWRGVEIVE